MDRIDEWNERIDLLIIASMNIYRPFVNLGIGIGNGTGIGTDITNAIISSSKRPMGPKIQGGHLGGEDPTHKVTWHFWYRGHVTNKRRYIFTFTRSIDP